MAEETAVAPGVETDRNATAVDAKKGKRPDQSYWSLVKHQYKKNKPAVAALYFFYFMFAVAIVADFLANDKPIVCSYKGEFYAPVLKDYAVGLGISSYPAELRNVNWRELKYDWSIFPPVHYTAASTDIMNSFAPPFQSGSDHYLGTDQPGRDVLAGLIHGARISLSIGFVSMGIATAIGLILGALAGYFGGWVDIVISRVIEVFLQGKRWPEYSYFECTGPDSRHYVATDEATLRHALHRRCQVSNAIRNPVAMSRRHTRNASSRRRRRE